MCGDKQERAALAHGAYAVGDVNSEIAIRLTVKPSSKRTARVALGAHCRPSKRHFGLRTGRIELGYPDSGCGRVASQPSPYAHR